MCAGCRCENVMFVFCSFFLLSRSEARTPFIRGGYSLSKYCVFCVTVYRPIVTLFSTFSSEWIALSDALEVDQFRRDLKTHLFE